MLDKNRFGYDATLLQSSDYNQAHHSLYATRHRRAASERHRRATTQAIVAQGKIPSAPLDISADVTRDLAGPHPEALAVREVLRVTLLACFLLLLTDAQALAVGPDGVSVQVDFLEGHEVLALLEPEVLVCPPAKVADDVHRDTDVRREDVLPRVPSAIACRFCRANGERK